MRKVAILTDNTAQFPSLSFPGRNLVRVISFDLLFRDNYFKDCDGIRSIDLPATILKDEPFSLVPPDESAFRQIFSELSKSFNEILVILSSNDLAPGYANAVAAVNSIQGSSAIQVINSQTTSVGLGILVQAAASIIAAGESITEAERQVRKMIPHIYTLICSPSLTFLYKSGYIDYTQAIIGEMSGLYPIFSLDEGEIFPQQKVRNFRNAIEFFQEFLEEFENLKHIALIQGILSYGNESRTLRQFSQEFFPNVPFTEHGINVPLSAMVGPKSLSLIAVEDPDINF